MKKIRPSYDKTFVCSDNLGQSNWNKKGKFSKTGQDKKIWYVLLRVFFFFFLLLLPKFDFLKGGWALGFVSIQIWEFFNVSLFPEILSLKSFCNSWGSSYTKFIVLDIKFRFNCGKSDLY